MIKICFWGRMGRVGLWDVVYVACVCTIFSKVL